MGYEVLSWGGNIIEVSNARSEYISSLKEADQGNYEPLKKFMFGQE
jgi:hypothetical protein